MCGNVLAGLLVVGGVDADGEAASEEAAVEGEHPFRCVEADDVDDCVFGEGAGEQGLCEFDALFVVLGEVVGELI